MNIKFFLLRIILLITFFSVGMKMQVLADDENNRLQYLFPAFTMGKVKMKTGESYQVMMDYNTVTEEMIFEQKGTRMVLSNPEAIDTVYLQHITFVTDGKIFYEALVSAPISLFVQHKSRVDFAGTPVGYGTSQIAASNGVAAVRSLSGAQYNLEFPDKDYTLHPETQYWIRKNNINFYAFQTLQLGSKLRRRR